MFSSASRRTCPTFFHDASRYVHPPTWRKNHELVLVMSRHIKPLIYLRLTSRSTWTLYINTRITTAAVAFVRNWTRNCNLSFYFKHNRVFTYVHNTNFNFVMTIYYTPITSLSCCIYRPWRFLLLSIVILYLRKKKQIIFIKNTMVTQNLEESRILFATESKTKLSNPLSKKIWNEYFRF